MDAKCPRCSRPVIEVRRLTHGDRMYVHKKTLGPVGFSQLEGCHWNAAPFPTRNSHQRGQSEL